MRELIHNDKDKCVGCNKCLRVCPIEEASHSVIEDGKLKVNIDNSKCIVCGACIAACHHGARYYEDDTERFIEDLRRGTPISLIAAPAMRTNIPEWGRVLTWLKSLGVKKIYDVSLGADICTWAHIRYIQKNRVGSLITQPCPAIVNYVLMHKTELVNRLSPVHSPMLCTAVYMRKHEGVADKIAALSPCIAKTNEFEATGMVEYNVTINTLLDYIENNGITLPAKESGFDHYESALGGIYSMPGGLKENVEFFLGKALRVDKSEGQHVVYDALDEFAKTPMGDLPAVFDVLNCPEGCNIGTGCRHDKNIFKISSEMNSVRTKATKDRDQEYFDKLYDTYDKTLNINDYIRRYRTAGINSIRVTENDMERAFMSMNKETYESRHIDCGACGQKSCAAMAQKIAKKLDLPNNCIQMVNETLNKEMASLVTFCKDNSASTKHLEKRISSIKTLSEDMSGGIENINISMQEYAKLAQKIDTVSTQIYMISVNASIEAARAGANGKAFSVVAEEIQKLAKSTKESLGHVAKTAAVSKQAFDDIHKDFAKIAQSISEASTDVGNISGATQELLDSIPPTRG